MNKFIYLSTVAFIGSLSAVQAADLNRAMPAPVPTLLPAYNWGGAYIGGSLGVGVQTTKWTDVDDWYTGDTYKLRNSGLMLGAYAGYNFLVAPQFLVGIETDIAYNFGDDRASVNDGEPAYITSDANWLGTTRLRLGWAMDRTLVYATGGLAYGNPSAQWHEGSGAAWKLDGWKVGYAVGGGVEQALSNNWTIRLEGLYYDLGKRNAKDITSALSGDYGDTDGYAMKTKSDGFLFRAGIAYKF